MRTLEYPASSIAGHAQGDILWQIVLSVNGGDARGTEAVISDAASSADTSPVHAYNEKEKNFSVSSSSAMSCFHCCRKNDFVDITITTAWPTVPPRRVTLDSNGQIIY